MNVFILLRSLPVLFLALLPYSALLSQQNDIRISPPDTATHPFPGSAMIQSADRIGDRSLVVWGGTLSVADTAVRGVLWGQIVQGMDRQGEPFIVSGDRARPEGTVSVVALADRFLVLWNDTRAADSGVYMRRVGLEGGMIGEETRLPASLQADSLVWVALDSFGYSIIWSEAVAADQPDYFRQRLNTLGLPDGGREMLRSADFDDEHIYDGLPGALITPGEPSLFYHADGRRDERTIPAGRLQGPYYLWPDTSLAVVDYQPDGQASFEYYANIFDTLPLRRIPIPQLEGQVPAAGAIAVDSSGRYRIFFLREQNHVSNPPIFRTMDLYSVTLLANGVFTDPILVLPVASGTDYTSNSATYTTEYSDVLYHNGDDNIHRITFKGRFRAFGRVDGFDINRVTHESYTLRFDRHGNLWELDPVRKEIARRDLRSRPVLTRSRSGDSSVVHLQETGGTVRLGIPLAALPQNYEQTNPGLVLCNGEIVAIWRQPEDRPRFHQARVFSRPDDVVIPLEPFIPDDIVPYRADRSYYENTAGVIPSAGGGFVRSASISATQFKLGQWSREFYLRTYFPTEHGWNKLAIGSDIHRWNTPVFDEHYSYDPNTGVTLSCFTSADYARGGRRIMLFSSAGSIIGDTIHTHPSVGALIADGGGNYLNIYNGRAMNSHGTLLFSLDSSAATGAAVYQRALGEYFFRYYPVDGLGPGNALRGPAIQFEQYDYHGNRVGAARIAAHGNYFDPYIVQRPADSSLHVIWPSDSGVWVTVIRPGFDRALPPVRLSATSGRVKSAVGVFRNDSLFAVWEDYRNGAADIYGTGPGFWSLMSAGPPAVPGNRGGGESCWLEAYPVPARHQVNILPGMPVTGMLRLIVSDAAGRAVIDRMIGGDGASSIPVGVEGFQPGIYFFSLMGADGLMGRGKFIVQ